MAGKISSNTSLASSYANKIKGKVGALSSSKSVSGSGETNLAVEGRCESCYSKKNSVLSSYTAKTAKDAAQLVNIAQSFEVVDKKAAKAAKMKGK
jgi:type VII secretion effector (TIGR04197 family)